MRRYHLTAAIFGVRASLSNDSDVSRFVAKVQDRWPDCDVEKLSRLAAEGELPGDPSVDFVLSRACLAGSDLAMGVFEREVVRPVHAQLQAAHADSGLLDDAAQTARIRLLVDGKLAGYRGRGALAGFVRVTISRLIIDSQRARKRDHSVSIEPWEPLLEAKSDPELAALRKSYGGALAEAIRNAWTKLDAGDRLILGMQLNEACGVQHIARLYDIHRTSAARRLVAARSRLIDNCRVALRESLGTSEQTLDSIIRAFAASSAWAYFERNVDSLFGAAVEPTNPA